MLFILTLSLSLSHSLSLSLSLSLTTEEAFEAGRMLKASCSSGTGMGRRDPLLGLASSFSLDVPDALELQVQCLRNRERERERERETRTHTHTHTHSSNDGTCMGGTLPVLVRRLCRRKTRDGRKCGGCRV
jgi:hypothetical protein